MHRPTLVHSLVLALLALAGPRIAHADESLGAVLATGNADAKKQTATVAAVTSALREAKWTLVDSPFTSKEARAIRACFQQDAPWPCIQPIATLKHVSRVVLVDLTVEKPGTIRVVAQVAAAGESLPGYASGYCTPACSETGIAQSATDVTAGLLAKLSASAGTTWLEVITDPPGAAVTIDGRQVGTAGQRFPVPAGRHRILVQMSGRHDADTEVEVADGETRRVPLTLQPLQVTGGPVVPGGGDHHRSRALPVAMMTVGGLAVVGGAIALGLDQHSETAPPGQPQRASYYNTVPAGVTAIAAGAIVAGIGAYVWWKYAHTPAAPSVAVGAHAAAFGIVVPF